MPIGDIVRAVVTGPSDQDKYHLVARALAGPEERRFITVEHRGFYEGLIGTEIAVLRNAPFKHLNMDPLELTGHFLTSSPPDWLKYTTARETLLRGIWRPTWDLPSDRTPTSYELKERFPIGEIILSLFSKLQDEKVLSYIGKNSIVPKLQMVQTNKEKQQAVTYYFTALKEFTRSLENRKKTNDPTRGPPQHALLTVHTADIDYETQLKPGIQALINEKSSPVIQELLLEPQRL
jgi:hypothetical protein